MLKLARNAFGEGTVAYDEGRTIHWGHAQAMHNIQETEGVRIRNKKKSAYINFQKKKMKD